MLWHGTGSGRQTHMEAISDTETFQKPRENPASAVDGTRTSPPQTSTEAILLPQIRSRHVIETRNIARRCRRIQLPLAPLLKLGCFKTFSPSGQTCITRNSTFCAQGSTKAACPEMTSRPVEKIASASVLQGWKGPLQKPKSVDAGASQGGPHLSSSLGNVFTTVRCLPKSCLQPDSLHPVNHLSHRLPLSRCRSCQIHNDDHRPKRPPWSCCEPVWSVEDEHLPFAQMAKVSAPISLQGTCVAVLVLHEQA